MNSHFGKSQQNSISRQTSRPTPRHTLRKPRWPLAGAVRVFIDFEPWRLMFHLDAVNISETGLLGVLRHDGPQNEYATNKNEIAALFTPGDPYSLQIEHDCPQLAAPVIDSRLRHKRETASGLEVAFAFDYLDADVALLVDELAQRIQ